MFGECLVIHQIRQTFPLYSIHKMFLHINILIIIPYLFHFVTIVIPWALESWAGYTITVYEDPDAIKKYHNTEHAFCLLNHRGDLDWLIGWVLVERLGMLGVS